MSLRESTIHRKLDAKMKIGGMEAPDLLAVLILAAAMNLIFGRTDFSFIFVIVIPALALLALYFGKRGKPDEFLIHLVRFYITPGYFSAGETGKHAETILNKRIYP